MPADKKKLLILGVHMNSEAYPNTRFRLEALKRSELFEVTEINFPLSSANLSRINGAIRKFGSGVRGLFAHVFVITRYVFSKKSDIVYVPYPAVFVLFMLSLLPGKLRPRSVVADAFISLYDTIVNDRALLAPRHAASRMLFWVEKKAYAFSRKVIVDTPQSARFLSALFDVEESKVEAIPLSTDEDNFLPTPYRQEADGLCRVLFVGTLVPLHGVETILAAASLLVDRKDIVFKIIGDGQDARKVEEWKSKHDVPLQWERAWQSSAQIASEIGQADICLGIFGAGNKAMRVCPFKIYAYAAVGRPIITGDTDWAREMLARTGEQFFETVPVADPTALARKISRLADDSNLREMHASYSRKFYDEQLSNKIAHAQLERSLQSS